MVSKTQVILAPLRAKNTLNKLLLLGGIGLVSFVAYTIYINQKNITDAFSATQEAFDNAGEVIENFFTETTQSITMTTEEVGKFISEDIFNTNKTPAQRTTPSQLQTESKERIDSLKSSGFVDVTNLPRHDGVSGGIVLEKLDDEGNIEKTAIIQDPALLTPLIEQRKANINRVAQNKIVGVKATENFFKSISQPVPVTMDTPENPRATKIFSSGGKFRSRTVR